MKKKCFFYSLKRSVPILIGFFPVGLAYGILMSNAGYNGLWSFFTSITVYAGSLQMLMVSFFDSSLPLFTIVVTALLLNSRHIFYGISFIEKFRSYGKLRYFLIYGLTDEFYSLLCAYQPVEGLDEKTVNLFTCLICWLGWASFSLLGGLAGSLITFDTTGIDFALTALFIVILVDQLRGRNGRLPACISAVSSALCLLLFGVDNFLLPALLLTVAALIVLRGRLEKPGEEAAP